MWSASTRPSFRSSATSTTSARPAGDGRQYPVAIDSDYAVWQAFANHYWPAVYVADAQGEIQHQQFGEGRYEECESVIQKLLARRARGVGRRVRLRLSDGFEVQADWENLESPETYLGYQQGAELRLPGRCGARRGANVRHARRLERTSGPSPGTGR